MKDLKILSEISTRYGNRNINELEFKTPAEFATYKKKHKMRPGTVVKVAGKDKVIDDPKKNTKPKGNKTADTLTKGLKDGGLNPYKDGPLINQALDDIGGDHSDLKKRIDTYGDNVPSSKGKSEAQYQKEIDKYKEEGEKLSNDIADAVSDKPKGKKTKSKPMPQPSDFGGDMDKYTAALNKRMKDDEKSSSDKPKKPKDFNGIDYEKMKGKTPGVWDKQAVNNLSNKNPELKKELGLTGDYGKDSEILDNLDLATISSIVDKYGDDYNKKSHMERLKDDHGFGGKPDVDPKTDKEMQKAAGDANEKMAKAEFNDAVDSDPSSVGDMIDRNIKNIPEDERATAEEALFALQDVEMGLIDDIDAEWAKEFLRGTVSKYIKEGKNSDLKQLSKITTRYNK